MLPSMVRDRIATPALSTPERLAERRQQALDFVERCQAVLRDRYGAKQVILFGSLAGQGVWHWDSDVDLAVAGLSQPDWLRAYDDLQTLAPSWLAVDVVRLEQVDPKVRARILQEQPMSSNPFLGLRQQLEDEQAALERTVIALNAALSQVGQVPEDFAVRTLASYINDFYRRCERMSERVAVALDGGLPQGVDWHRALLRQVAGAQPGGRPALWAGELLLDLDEYRKFRHLIHHKYGDELRPDYVLELAELAPTMLVKIQQAIAVFTQWLEGQAGA